MYINKFDNIFAVNKTNTAKNRINNFTSSPPSFLKKELQSDKFEKQISFCAKGKLPFDSLEEFSAATSELPVAEISQFAESIAKRMQLENFIQHRFIFVDSESATKKLLRTYGAATLPFSYFAMTVQETDGFTDEQTQSVISLFNDAGIKTVRDLVLFSNAFLTEDVFQHFDGQPIEALDIYGKLSRKSALKDFPELLLFLYNDSKKSGNESAVIGEYMDFMREIDVSCMDEFEERFSDLKPLFNNFENITDKVEAIDYLRSVHPHKIALVADAIEGKNIRKTPEEMYRGHCDIIDFLYEKSGRKNLGEFPEIAELLASRNNIKKPANNQLAPYFNDFATTADAVDAFMLLKNSEVSVAEFNEMAACPSFAETDFSKCISNKPLIVAEISAKTGCRAEEAMALYKKLCKVLSPLYECSLKNKDKHPFDLVLTMVDVARKYKISNTDSFAGFYKKVTNSKQKQITIQELYNFVELFRYTGDENVFNAAKAQNITPIEYLNKQKDCYTKNKSAIIAFLKDHRDIFPYENAREFYVKYKSAFEANDDTDKAFADVLMFGKENNSPSAQFKREQMGKITPYFNSVSDAAEFISNNSIKLDDTEDSQAFLSSCVEIFDSIKNSEETQEAAFEKIKKLSDSGFLGNSQETLTDFMQKYPIEKYPDLFDIIIEKRVYSASDLDDFLETRKDAEGNVENILIALQDAPDDIDFSCYKNTISKIEKALGGFYTGLKIDNGNISLIKVPFYKNGEMLPDEINRLICKLTGHPETENFVKLLKGAINVRGQKYSKYKITAEILKNAKKDNNYGNILRELGLKRVMKSMNKDLPENAKVDFLSNFIPDDFIEFVNSDDWITDNKDEIPNLSLHARLRFIERFALRSEGDINILKSDMIKNRLRSLISSIYNNPPLDLHLSKESGIRFVVESDSEYGNIETVFSRYGNMVTVHFK